MTPEAPIIHLVDDDASFLSAMSRFLRASGFSVERYASATDFLARRRTGAPGCVLVDLQMPGLSGLDLQAVLASSPDPLPIVFLTAHGDIPTSVRAMRRGAEDFLTKRASKEELLAAVKRALDRDLRERAEREHLQDIHRRLEALSAREREVLALVVQGKLNKEIASELGIHERTVKLHRTAITTKLQVQSVAQLTRLAQEAGLLP
jgi:two-component system, LuxR family, response regulator FixJ